MEVQVYTLATQTPTIILYLVSKYLDDVLGNEVTTEFNSNIEFILEIADLELKQREPNKHVDEDYFTKLFDLKDDTVLKNSTEAVECILENQEICLRFNDLFDVADIRGIFALAWFAKQEVPHKELVLPQLDGFVKKPIILDLNEFLGFRLIIMEYILYFYQMSLPLGSDLFKKYEQMKEILSTSEVSEINNLFLNDLVKSGDKQFKSGIHNFMDWYLMV